MTPRPVPLKECRNQKERRYLRDYHQELLIEGHPFSRPLKKPCSHAPIRVPACGSEFPGPCQGFCTHKPPSLASRLGAFSALVVALPLPYVLSKRETEAHRRGAFCVITPVLGGLPRERLARRLGSFLVKRIVIALAAVLTLSLAACSETATPEPTETGVAVTDVVGQTGDEAREALTEDGFLVEFDAGDETVIMASNWIVESQSPAADELVESGSTITLTVTKPEETAAPSDLAQRVENELLAAFGVESFTDLLGEEGVDGLWPYIASIEDVSTGTIEIYVQVTETETTNEEVKMFTERVLTLIGAQLPDLEWVVAQTADGQITEQTSRKSVTIPGE